MIENKRTFCIIMGGGRGTRMYPLTSYRSKPAVPLGGRYRLIDIPISNCLNSGFNQILVLTQYNSESLNRHIFRTYKLDGFSGGFVEIYAAQQSYDDHEWFQGTADSVRRTLPHIQDPRIDEVIVLSGDQLFSMDLKKIQENHRKSGADVTVACHPEPENAVRHFGIMGIDKESRITSFLEKPKDASLIDSPPVEVNGKPHHLANMGIYIFKKEVLSQILTEHEEKDDFGKEIIPAAIKTKKVNAFIFDEYWSDIGNIRSFYDASLMLTEPNPLFNLYDEEWPIYTRPRYLPPAKVIRCEVEESSIAEGCIIQEAKVKKSIIGLRSRIGKGTVVENSIVNGNDYYQKGGDSSITPGIGDHCVIKNAIIDKNVSIGNHVKITNKNKESKLDESMYSIRDGIVVIHKGAVIPDHSEI